MKGNAIIEKTMLGIEDHGIMTFYIDLKQSGSGQGFGGYTLDDRPLQDAQGHRFGDRQPSILCGFCIKRILDVVGVNKWEDLVGKHVRVDGEEYGDIYAIGHIIEDKWFRPKQEIGKLIKEKSPVL